MPDTRASRPSNENPGAGRTPAGALASAPSVSQPVERAGAGRFGLLFGLAVFSSAFLIFFVQPMVGKHILPWFGGSPGVWTLCLAFYQTSLFAGYAYAHALVAHTAPRTQLAVHGAAFVAAAFALPVLPGVDWKPAPDQEPSLRILAMLAANVALPFALLAATGPLLQAWYARVRAGRSPYALYAVSNAGSLLALVAFPFGVEPHLTLSFVSRMWSFAFLACGGVILTCAVAALRPAAPAGTNSDAVRAPSRAPAVGLWIALPAAAVVLLMGVTHELCLDVASVPFLWILPLAVYLITFVVCFASERLYPRWILLSLFALSCAALVALGHRSGIGGAGELDLQLPVQIGLYALLLFAGCTLAHGELYRLRPAPRQLTRYYLCISGGGALGGLAVGIGAPLVFDAYRELPLGVAACALGFAVACGRDRIGRGARWAAWSGGAVVALLAVVGWVLPQDGEALLRPQERNFFGVLRVKDLDPGDVSQHRYVLQSGRIDHGVQFVLPQARRRPTSYYGEATGIGLACASRPAAERAQVGVVGLGIGTLAAYGRAGDRFRFYEIDPSVLRIARDDGDFTFLADSAAELEFVLGDARLSLERERDHGGPIFDLLVVDAFSSDSIPVHLLTREAFELYRDRLAPGGVLAVHVSNTHLDLAPLVHAVGAAAGLGALTVVNQHQSQWLSRPSIWVLLAARPKTLEGLARRMARRRAELGIADDATRFQNPARAAVDRSVPWTDDYSDLFSVLR